MTSRYNPLRLEGRHQQLWLPTDTSVGLRPEETRAWPCHETGSIAPEGDEAILPGARRDGDEAPGANGARLGSPAKAANPIPPGART